jgi:NAD(P)-dependent dehydrogenase (short-subunit alcohol dehydrogenase family)
MPAPVTVITGGGTGVGAALARLLTERGHKVVIAGRRKDPLDAVAADTGATVVVGDLSNEKGAKGLIDAAVAAHGKIDNLVLNNTTVPEPMTVAMVGLGLLGVSLTRRRKA